MNSRPFRTTLVAALVVLAAALVAGCGGVPGDAVATVDGNAITKKTFDHWLTIAAKSGGQPDGAIPMPPDFKDCIATKRKALPTPAKGQPATTDDQLKEQCSTEYKALRDQVLQLLISFQWLEGEAKDRGVSVSDAEVQKMFDEQKKASFPQEDKYQDFLKQTGQSEADILMRVKLQALSDKLRDKITEGKDDVSDADVTKYYNENKTRFAQPEQRDLLVVLTKTQDKAKQAKAAIQGGQKFADVVKKFSIDPQSKAQGGKLPAVTKSQQDKDFGDAAFKAKKGELVGPVKTQFGYYVFKVTKITPASQQSEQEVSTTIKQLLASQQQMKVLDDFVKSFTKKWRNMTECAKDYKTPDCKNGPNPTPTPTAPAGGVPQQVPPPSGQAPPPQSGQAPPPQSGQAPPGQAPPPQQPQPAPTQ